jgi:hypothetical protein
LAYNAHENMSCLEWWRQWWRPTTGFIYAVVGTDTQTVMAFLHRVADLDPDRNARATDAHMVSTHAGCSYIASSHATRWDAVVRVSTADDPATDPQPPALLHITLDAASPGEVEALPDGRLRARMRLEDTITLRTVLRVLAHATTA